MSEAKIYYKGLCGSRNMNIHSEDSDYDYVLISDDDYHREFNVNGKDLFYKNNVEVINWTFDKDPSEVVWGEFANDNPCDILFSTPADDYLNADFTKWLLENREAVALNNRPRFERMLLAECEHFVTDESKNFLYYLPLKNLMKPLAKLCTYNHYGRNKEDFASCKMVTPEERDFFLAIRTCQVSNFEVMNYMTDLYNESLQYRDWYSIPGDVTLCAKLKDEMRELLEV